MPRPRCNVPGRPDRDIWATVAVPTCPSPPEPKCSEAIKFCEPNIKRSDDGLAILRSNPIYRASDIIYQRGMRWRRDSIAILCNNCYRGTLLRKVLEATTTYDSNIFHAIAQLAAERDDVRRRRTQRRDARRAGALAAGARAPSPLAGE